MKNLRLYLTDKQKCSTCRGLSENTNINVSHRMSALEFHSQFLGRMDGWMDAEMDRWLVRCGLRRGS